jgi:hypothetical protein
MRRLEWLPWVTGNRNHQWTRGPFYAAWGKILGGVQAREQANYGVVDLAFCALGGEDARSAESRGEDWLPWATRNGAHDWERPTFVTPPGHVLVGLDLKEQGGFGIVDMRCVLRAVGGGPIVEGPWLCGNPNGTVRRAIVPEGGVVAGVDVREQGGFGIVDVRLAYLVGDDAGVEIALELAVKERPGAVPATD